MSPKKTNSTFHVCDITERGEMVAAFLQETSSNRFRFERGVRMKQAQGVRCYYRAFDWGSCTLPGRSETGTAKWSVGAKRVCPKTIFNILWQSGCDGEGWCQRQSHLSGQVFAIHLRAPDKYTRKQQEEFNKNYLNALHCWWKKMEKDSNPPQYKIN